MRSMMLTFTAIGLAVLMMSGCATIKQDLRQYRPVPTFMLTDSTICVGGELRDSTGQAILVLPQQCIPWADVWAILKGHGTTGPTPQDAPTTIDR